MKKVELEAARAAGGRQGGRRKRNPIEDLKREVAIMRKLRHKNITALQEVSQPDVPPTKMPFDLIVC